MRSETWLAALDHELAILGLPAADRADVLVETETYLADAGVDALQHFGPPAEYAMSLTAAAGRPPPQLAHRPERRVIDAHGLARSYRGRPVLADVSLDVRPGDLVALIGSNGAGKSTLLRLLAGVERPSTGSVRIDGSIGYAPQAGGLDPYLRATEHFELFGAAAGLTRRDARREGRRLARELGWDASEAPIAAELSGGTRQKLNVVAALIGDPDLLLLDEPCQGMDAPSTWKVWELLWTLCDAGKAAVVSSHDADVLRHARTVVELEDVAP